MKDQKNTQPESTVNPVQEYHSLIKKKYDLSNILSGQMFAMAICDKKLRDCKRAVIDYMDSDNETSRDVKAALEIAKKQFNEKDLYFQKKRAEYEEIKKEIENNSFYRECQRQQGDFAEKPAGVKLSAPVYSEAQRHPGSVV